VAGARNDFWIRRPSEELEGTDLWDDEGLPVDRLDQATLWTSGARRQIEFYAEVLYYGESMVVGQGIEWRSSDPDVVRISVSADGSVVARGLSEGRATVRAKLGDMETSVAVTVEKTPSAGE
jgi:hypothetical protein